MPPRRRITFEWGGELLAAGEYSASGPLWHVLQEAARVVLDGGSPSSRGAGAAALAIPPGAPGHAFLAALVEKAAREKAWESGAQARDIVVKLLAWMVSHAGEVMGLPAAAVRAAAAAASAVFGPHASGAGEPADSGRAYIYATSPGHHIVNMGWRGIKYNSTKRLKLNAATAAACADVARITLRGREAAIVDGNNRGLNFPPGGPTPNAYITALLAAAPADDARWLAAGSGEPRHADAFAAAHAAIAAYLEHIGHPSAAAAAALRKGEPARTGYCGIIERNGHTAAAAPWKGHTFISGWWLDLDKETAAACADVVRITLRGREATIVKGNLRGLNFPPDGPAPNAYITALLAAAPADDARWLEGGRGKPRHEAAFTAAHAAVAAYLTHIGHPSAAAAAHEWARHANAPANGAAGGGGLGGRRR
jgi:hypothetical protein